ncbi:hypothetical protein BCT86_08780 [Vibrio breoganii]|uniref:hypothetical protein n=1 Tax=Vibrio breoganii TaxID=553239 RepID=UPI000C8564C1|nr:hypothetical protein [Vibrio breoganii]PMG91221.1 hypothetical protein BCU80_01375 [Vibrio breoganii]PML08483.1 hypothetical protein BCT86_08780 [Vibrio breoganii]
MIRLCFVIFIITFSALSHSTICEGRWSVKVDNNSLFNKGDYTFVPVFVQLQPSVVKCKPQGVYVRSEKVGSVILKSKESSFSGKILDSSGHTSGLNTTQGSVYSLSQGNRTKLLLSFPKVKRHPAGIYKGNLTFSLVGVEGIKVLNEVVMIKVPPYVNFGIMSDNNSAYIADFGVLETGDTKKVELYFRSNTSVYLNFEPEYGHLKHSNYSDSRISYELFLDNRKVIFNEDFSLGAVNSFTSTQRKMTVKIGNTDNSRAGQYKERITITATARP